MGPKHWGGLVVVALGLVLGALLLRGREPQSEGVRVGRPQETEVAGAAEVALESVRARDDAGERMALESAAGSTSAVSAASEPAALDAAGVRTGVWVKVVDEQRTPLRNVRVALRSAAKPGGKPESLGTSSADGMVWLTMQLGTDASKRRVEPAGPAPRVDGVTFDPAQLGDEPLLLVLRVGAGLDVHVIDEGGGSAEGALVRLVSPGDYDAAFGNFRRIDGAVMVEGYVRDGVCSFQYLPADADLLLYVQGPLPLGPLSLRTRTPGSGKRATAEARYSADDILLLGELRGDVANVRWDWALFDPAPPRSMPWGSQMPLHVADDGRFVVRLPPDAARTLGPAVCLTVFRDSELLEAVELPPLGNIRRVSLAPMDAATSILCAGRVYTDSQGDLREAQLVVRGSASPGGAEIFHAAGWAQPDEFGRFSFFGRVPSHWKWELQSVAGGWEVADPAAFLPGTTDHRAQLLRAEGHRIGRLVPGSALSASEGWWEHLSVQLHSRHDRRIRSPYIEAGGRFELDVPPAQLAKITVRARWHDRPLLEWNVDSDAALDVVLPPGLRLVRLDVRGAGGIAVAAAAWDPKLDRARWNKRRAESPLSVLLDVAVQDVLVQADGYRDTLVPAVSGHRRVDLARLGVPLLLRAVELPELPQHFRLRPLLSRGPAAHSDFSGKLEFDSRGTVTLLAGDLGEHYVHLQLEHVTEGRRSAQIIDGETSPRIHVVEPTDGQGPAEFTLTFDRARILAALEALRQRAEVPSMSTDVRFQRASRG